MEIMTPERTQAGVDRLLRAPLDLAECGAPTYRNDATGASAHRDLFKEYAEVIEVVSGVALEWWNEILHARRAQIEDGNDDDAEREAWLGRPAGPAACPAIVAVVRDYWLACEQINVKLEPEQRVAPWILLLGWLRDGEHGEAVRVLSCMPYWPIGLDEQGDWV